MYTVYTLDYDMIPEVDLPARRDAIRYMRQFAPGRLLEKRKSGRLRLLPLNASDGCLSLVVARYIPDRVVPRMLAWAKSKVDQLTCADVPQRYKPDPADPLAAYKPDPTDPVDPTCRITIDATAYLALTGLWRRSPFARDFYLPPACVKTVFDPFLVDLVVDTLWSRYLAAPPR